MIIHFNNIPWRVKLVKAALLADLYNLAARFRQLLTEVLIVMRECFSIANFE